MFFSDADFSNAKKGSFDGEYEKLHDVTGHMPICMPC
jgi:hypothetical protein